MPDKELQLYHELCKVHRNTTHVKSVCGLQERTQTFILYCSLCFNFGDAMTMFREDLRAAIRGIFRYERGPSPPGCKQKLAFVLDRFIPEGRGKIGKLIRAILETLITGDIEDDLLVHYCCGCCTGFEDSLQKCTTWLVAALVPHKPPTFSRSRWLERENATNYFGLIESICRLFSKAFIRFCNRLGLRRAGKADGGHVAAAIVGPAVLLSI